MVSVLNFEWNPQRGESVAKFVSVGPVTVQILRARLRNVVVQGNLPGLSPSFVAEYGNSYDLGILFGIDVGVGVEVTVRVGCEVTEAKMMSDD